MIAIRSTSTVNAYIWDDEILMQLHSMAHMIAIRLQLNLKNKYSFSEILFFLSASAKLTILFLLMPVCYLR